MLKTYLIILPVTTKKIQRNGWKRKGFHNSLDCISCTYFRYVDDQQNNFTFLYVNHVHYFIRYAQSWMQKCSTYEMHRTMWSRLMLIAKIRAIRKGNALHLTIWIVVVYVNNVKDQPGIRAFLAFKIECCVWKIIKFYYNEMRKLYIIKL